MLVTEQCQSYYDEILRTAKGIGQEKQLNKVLKSLALHDCRDSEGKLDENRARCWLYKGPLPMSFLFNMERRDSAGNYVFTKNGMLFLKTGDIKGPKWVIHS